MQDFLKQTTLPLRRLTGHRCQAEPRPGRRCLLSQSSGQSIQLCCSCSLCCAHPYKVPNLFYQVMAGLKEQFVSIKVDGWTKTQGSEHVLNLMPHVMAVHPEASATPCCQVDVAGPGVLACWWSVRVFYSYLYKQKTYMWKEVSSNLFSVVACLEIMINCKKNGWKCGFLITVHRNYKRTP